MISIIVLSKNDELFCSLKKSIIKTIGVPYEIICVPNSDSSFSIFSGYNFGANKSKFDYLLFIHEDVIFHTENWGILLLKYFEDLDNLGVLGIAGSSYLPISPSDWWLGNPNYLHANFLSNAKDGRVGGGIPTKWGKQIPVPVFALDGMFLAIKKIVWEEFRFDENLYGFHGYDTSICYQVSQKYQNYFVPGILMEHFSKGDPNETWLKNTVIANQLVLPFILENKKLGFLNSSLEIISYRLFLRQLMKFSSNTFYKFSMAWYYLLPVLKYTKDLKILIFFFFYSFRYFLQAIRIK